MPEKTRLIGQLGILFIVVAVLLALMDRQMLTGPETLAQWPFALLSLLLLAGLFGVVAVLVTHRLGALLSGARDPRPERAPLRASREAPPARPAVNFDDDLFEQPAERQTPRAGTRR